MKSISVKSRHQDYRIVVGQGLLKKTGSLLKALGLRGKVFIVSQSRVAQLYAGPVKKSLRQNGFAVAEHNLPDGEEAKSEKELFQTYHDLLDKDFERRDIVLALGGGVVGDLAGFAASTFLRGVPFVNIGTTLLAQVDSSIGGKTGINLGQGKNLVGAFYPSRLVISDTEVLKTLPDRDLHASLAEVVKYGVIRDLKLFSLIEKKTEDILAKESSILEKLVLASARIKAGVVSRDEFETQGERMILNFGHTFAHAFEQTLNYRKLMHGEAVAIGMVCAARLANRLKLFPFSETSRLVRVLENLHLPVSLSGLDLDRQDILSGMLHDKKKRAGKLRFVLPTKIGRVIIRENIPSKLLKEVVDESLGK
ncbi:MAG: 3-dehydroquinate synthase [Candidatus Omnitrophica bacterium]|nr:3-dehydroquinate synthase [Candidatus Omnitrophota bacterium]